MAGTAFYALGRYSQSISVAKALALGIGAKVKGALDTTIRLSPAMPMRSSRSDVHAEVTTRSGSLLGLTQAPARSRGSRATRRR